VSRAISVAERASIVVRFTEFHDESPMSHSTLTHTDKVERLVQDLVERGVWPSTVAPPIYRILWRLGVEVPPPHFASLTNGLMIALDNAIFFGLPFWMLLNCIGRSLPLWKGLALAFGPGLAIGLAVALYYRWQSRRLGLGSWENYSGNVSDCRHQSEMMKH